MEFDRLMKLGKEFFESTPIEPEVFFIWGMFMKLIMNQIPGLN